MTFLLLLIPSLPATPTFWTFRRVSSIKYPSIYHNPPPSTPPPRTPLPTSPLCVLPVLRSHHGLRPCAGKNSLCRYISFGFPPSYFSLHSAPSFNFLQVRHHRLFSLSFPSPFLLPSFLLGQDPRQSLFLTIFGAFVIV